MKEDVHSDYSVLFQVIVSISNLMNHQESLQNHIEKQEGEPQVEMVAIRVLVDAVLEDACTWVRSNSKEY